MCADEAASGWVAHVNAGGTRGYTALMHAVRSNKLETVEAILDRGTSVDATDESGTSSLAIARKLSHDAIAESLKAHGAWERGRSQHNYSGREEK